MSNDPILNFWNTRAGLKARAGSNDLIAKQLEIEAISCQIEDGMNLAEFGCGNGATAVEIASRFEVQIDAFDFSTKMVSEAQAAANEHCVSDRVKFFVADIRQPPTLEARYDVVYTERMLINLPDWDTQAQAIATLAGYLRVGGRLVLCENSTEGLFKLNELRTAVGLQGINPPWHNVYLDDTKMTALSLPNASLVSVIGFSSTYYFLSRVVNAWLSKREGIEPSYDAPVNHLALSLPAIGDYAQGKLWIWSRTG